MNKKLLTAISTGLIAGASIATPLVSTAGGFMDQRATQIGVAGADQWGQGNEGFIWFVQSAVNWILALLGLITIIILIYGGFQMVTAAGDDNKYKKGFTIVKQAAIGLILIGVSALIVNLIFAFVNSNAQTANTGTTTQ